MQTVNARDLHAFLKVGRVFGAWIQGRIAKYGFVENADFVTVEGLSFPDRESSKGTHSVSTLHADGALSSPDLATSKSGRGGARPQRTTEYHLTMDMAKELSMVENNAQGRAARRYFIDCERRAKEAEAVRVGPLDAYPEIPAADSRIQMVAECRRIHGARAARKLWVRLGMPGVDDELDQPPRRLALFGDARDAWCERIIEALTTAREGLSDRKLMVRAAVSSVEFSAVVGRLEQEGLMQSFWIRGQRFYRAPDETGR
ncbi:hypothetical protein GCM10025880_27280 [Methylorubrum aminovorans]|uniref:antA/AntB antirepressor family protein n=1 Tax=Methylorubrum aminovorans TaxID=269069 RepID=UPI0023E9FB82|nr:antA/AntB antirepressor family protein [Methylorubrum aminovorans]GMA76311.1 hypothetical protein GCM10025880_27280 [Methylorubrum aminovorans]